MNSTSPLPLMDKASSFHKITDCQGWKKPGNSSLQPLSPGPIIDALGFRCHLQAGPPDWNLWPKNLPGAPDHTPCGFVDTSVWVSIDTSHSTMSSVQSTISAHKPVLPGEPSPQCPQPSHLITYRPRYGGSSMIAPPTPALPSHFPLHWHQYPDSEISSCLINVLLKILQWFPSPLLLSSNSISCPSFQPHPKPLFLWHLAPQSDETMCGSPKYPSTPYLSIAFSMKPPSTRQRLHKLVNYYCILETP